jgi:hypothetical protein
LYGWINFALALICLICVLFILKTPNILALLIFANPYTLLLLTNYTKEQALFIGVFMLWLGFRSHGLIKDGLYSFTGLLFLLIRPIYAPIFIAARFLRNNQNTKFMLMLILVVLVVLVYVIMNKHQFLYDLFYSRAGIGHVGRDFFSYLCHEERLTPFDFIYCSIPTIMGLPWHEDIFGLGGLIVMMFALPIYIIMLSKKINFINKFYIFLIYMASNLVIFWWGPTYGAYLRYSMPVTWFLFFIFYFNNQCRFKSEMQRCIG